MFFNRGVTLQASEEYRAAFVTPDKDSKLVGSISEETCSVFEAPQVPPFFRRILWGCYRRFHAAGQQKAQNDSACSRPDLSLTFMAMLALASLWMWEGATITEGQTVSLPNTVEARNCLQDRTYSPLLPLRSFSSLHMMRSCCEGDSRAGQQNTQETIWRLEEDPMCLQERVRGEIGRLISPSRRKLPKGASRDVATLKGCFLEATDFS